MTRMYKYLAFFFRAASLLLSGVKESAALADTDCVSYGCDPTGSGHNPRHNISPDLLKDPSFRILWNKTFLQDERF